ncbi:MAG: hypothetical protein V2A58_10975 [Planctomycetota bacterium]
MPDDTTLRLDLVINLVLMIGTAAFFLGFPALFAPWPPRHFSDVVALVVAGEVYGLANAIWSKAQGSRAGPLGPRIFAGVYGSYAGGFVILILTYAVQVLVLGDPKGSSDFLAARLLLFGPPVGAIASAIVVWVYDSRPIEGT